MQGRGLVAITGKDLQQKMQRVTKVNVVAMDNVDLNVNDIKAN